MLRTRFACNASTVSLLLLFLAWTLEVIGDADFDSVKVKMIKNTSGRWDSRIKYWHESTFHPHYDGRFANHTLNYEAQRTNLSLLMESYLSTMSDIGVETWIMHGTLMGWWWNRKILPWDSDIDVQVSAPAINFLAGYYNMTLHKYKGRSYLLEINPHYVNSSSTDYYNTIDGRYFDTDTGLFIDITTLWPKSGHVGKLSCKDGHEYEEADIFPLRQSIFESQLVNIPYSYLLLLQAEYGKTSLTRTAFQNHIFNTESMEWERITAQIGGAQQRALPKSQWGIRKA